MVPCRVYPLDLASTNGSHDSAAQKESGTDGCSLWGSRIYICYICLPHILDRDVLFFLFFRTLYFLNSSLYFIFLIRTAANGV
ncbi:hypothetical protein GDO78_018597 [Eleutherodactylus coqui]|uniref:Uncharacterized protein n=1 Tax=Eleutherodactylus coqui TaxID=57060 RepID=A0A8J6BHQ8_ELECQ|nr:hypothetical protein GDO78_018597 [Eleutherodactylus coqui]